MMERAGEDRGEIVIRTRFGEVAADARNFSKPLEELLNDPEWCEAVGLEGCPFCYNDLARAMPF